LEKIKKFFASHKAELKKIIWPTPKKAALNTAAALATMVASGALVFGFDKLATMSVKAIMSLL